LLHKAQIQPAEIRMMSPSPPLPDTHEAIAAASAIDEDPRCRDESPTVRLALILSISTTIKSIQDIMRKDVGVDGDAQRISQLGLDAVPENLRRQESEWKSADDELPLAPAPSLRWRNWAADAEGITGDELLDFVNNELFPAQEPDRRTGDRAASSSARLRGCLQLHEVRHS
jgi:hypothetical protein